MKKNFFVAALFFCSQSFAQPDPKQDTTILDNVVITSNKFEKKQSRTGKVVTVLDRSHLDQMNGRTLGEILNTVAATTIIGANNNPGTNQRISIRGASDGNVLVLIDGVPVNDPSVIANYFDINFINTSSIEKIEVLKGAQSTLYGSDAVAGVIHIITKKPTGDFNGNAHVHYGSYNTVHADAGIRGTHGITSFSVFGGVGRSNGFSAAHDAAGSNNFDKDAFNQQKLLGSLQFKISKKFDIGLSGDYSRYRTDLDAAAFTDDKDFYGINKNVQTGINANWQQENGRLKFTYRYNNTNRFYLDDSADRGSFAYYSKSNYTGSMHYAEIYENLKWKSFEMLAGIDYRWFNTDQHYKSVSSFGPYESSLTDTLAKMNQWSPYASFVYNNGGLNFEAGARLNKHSTYGNHFTYSFNPSYLLAGKLKLFFNIGSAFKSPSLFQLFEPYIGNKELAPEKSIVTEGGFEIFAANGIHFRATAFSRKTDNAIQFIITDPVFYSGKYMNINNQKNHGLEVEQRIQSEKWNMYLNYTWTNGKTTSRYSESGMHLIKDTVYNNLYRVPEHAVNLFAAYNISKKLQVTTLVKVAGKRWEPVYAAAPQQLEGYHTIDLSTKYALTNKLKVYLDLKNLTNQKYFEVAGYNTKHFNFTGGLQFQF